MAGHRVCVFGEIASRVEVTSLLLGTKGSCMIRTKLRAGRVRWPGRRELVVEPLESRAMLAGDVLAALDAAGVLQISGDARANNIALAQNSATGAFVLSGVNTTINGLSSSLDLSTL